MQSGVASKPNFAGCTGDGPTLRGFSRRLQYVVMRSYVGLTGSPSNSYSSDSSADRSISTSIYEELEHEFLTQKCHEDTLNIMYHYVKKIYGDNKESDLTPGSKKKFMEIMRSNIVFDISSSIQSFLVGLNQKLE